MHCLEMLRTLGNTRKKCSSKEGGESNITPFPIVIPYFEGLWKDKPTGGFTTTPSKMAVRNVRKFCNVFIKIKCGN